MKRRAACALLVLAGALSGGAAGGSCSPLTCSPTQVTLARGTLLGTRATASGALRVLDLRTGRTRWRLPGGVLNGHLLVHLDGTLLTWFDASTGARAGDAVLQAHGRFALVGSSVDGTRAVLARTEQRSTTFVLVTRRSERDLSLPGNTWQFDALDGPRLFLTHWIGGSYDVRLYDLAAGALAGGRLGERLRGTAWNRVVSSDGRFVSTLYVGPGSKAMLHVLDVRGATARCVDLQLANAGLTTALVADPDRRHVWVISPKAGEVISVDTVQVRVATTLRASFGKANETTPIAVLAPDGERFAVSDGYHIWFVVPALRRVVQRPPHVSIAVGFSPDQKSLWVLGERSRFSRLRLR